MDTNINYVDIQLADVATREVVREFEADVRTAVDRGIFTYQDMIDALEHTISLIQKEIAEEVD